MTPRIALHWVATPDAMDLAEFATAAAERGFEGLFLPEHTHIPVSRATPYPGGIPMPEKYARVWDPFIALTLVAALTSLTVGTCVALVGQHDPIALAKAIATLDVLSGGRFVLGVGYGWNREEFEDHGAPRGALREVVRENVDVMQRLWADEVASFSGEHVTLSPSWSWPKPVQQPSPPVLLGVPATDWHFRELARWADGWIPMAMPTADALAPDVERLHRHWDAAGRDPETVRISVMQLPEREQIARDVERFAELGVERLLIDIPTAPAEEILPVLDDLAQLLST